jgi:hypothetical protein
MSNLARQPKFRFGLGGASLGNEFNKHTDKGAGATLEAARAVGMRYFDVGRWYGFGLSERRFGHFLHNQKREDYLLSSKVGKLFAASKNQDSDDRDRKARQTQGSRRPVRRRSTQRCVSVLGGGRCRGHFGRGGAKRGADSVRLQLAKGQDSFRCLGRTQTARPDRARRIASRQSGVVR